MKNPMQSRSRKGFTLVELLVVIAIIATLAALAIPTTIGVMRSAKIQEGSKVATDLVFAVDSFKSDYDYYPYPSSPENEDTNFTLNGNKLLEVLMGTEDEVNTRSVSYFEYKQTSKKRAGIEYENDAPKAVWDAFGNPFMVLIDYDLDGDLNSNSILPQVSDSEGDSTIRGKAALSGSGGYNAELPPAEQLEKYCCKSW